MDERHVTESIESYLKGKGFGADSLSLDSFPALFVGYYRDVHFDKLNRENDDDMLLYQYGTYDWGLGPFFEIDFVRQLCEMPPGELDPDIYQQHITFYFEPVKFQDISSFNLWSNDSPNLEQFERTILASAGFVAALGIYPLRTSVSFEPV